MLFRLICYFCFVFMLLPSTLLMAKDKNTLSAADKRNLAKADHFFFSKIRTAKEVDEGIRLYANLYKKFKDNPHITVCYCYMIYFKNTYHIPIDDMPGAEKYFKAREKAYRKIQAMLDELLKKPIKDKTLRAQAYLTYGLVVGELSAIVRSAVLLFKAKKALEQGIAIDPTVNQGALYIALGRMYNKTPGILFGSDRKSLEYLRKAQNLKDNSLIAYFYEVETIMDGRDPKDLHGKERKKIIDLLNQIMKDSKKKTMTPEEEDTINNSYFGVKVLLEKFSKTKS